MGQRKTPFLNSGADLLKSAAFLCFWCPWDIQLFKSLCNSWPNFCIVGHLKSGSLISCWSITGDKWVIRKWLFNNCSQPFILTIILLSLSVGYSANLSCVRCMVTLLFVAPAKVGFQQLLETVQIIGSLMFSVSVAYSARFGFV